MVNRIHADLDHGLPIIRGEDGPRSGGDERIAPNIQRLSYRTKTTKEMIFWLALLELSAWCLIRFSPSSLGLLGWFLAALGGIILLVWLWCGVASSRPRGTATTIEIEGKRHISVYSWSCPSAYTPFLCWFESGFLSKR